MRADCNNGTIKNSGKFPHRSQIGKKKRKVKAMSEIKIKNKKVSYSEELSGNKYTLKFSYTKPANAHNNAQKFDGELSVFFFIEENVRYNGRVRETEQETTASSRLYINNKYILTRSYLYQGENGAYLSECVSYTEYNPAFANINILTEADGKFIHTMVYEITKNSAVFNLDTITKKAEAQHKVNALADARKKIKEAEQNLKNAREEYAALLESEKLTADEAQLIVELVEGGADAEEVRNTARLVLA